jgi:DNA-binding response OmpR family regulator
LTLLETLKVGPLTVQHGGAIILWRDRVVRLTPARRLLVAALARAAGAPIRRYILAEAIGYDGDQPDCNVAVHLSRTRQAFRAVDFEFDQIENVHGCGLRWRVDA